LAVVLPFFKFRFVSLSITSSSLFKSLDVPTMVGHLLAHASNLAGCPSFHHQWLMWVPAGVVCWVQVSRLNHWTTAAAFFCRLVIKRTAVVMVMVMMMMAWLELALNVAVRAADDMSTHTSGVSTVDSATQQFQRLDSAKSHELQMQLKEMQDESHRWLVCVCVRPSVCPPVRPSVRLSVYLNVSQVKWVGVTHPCSGFALSLLLARFFAYPDQWWERSENTVNPRIVAASQIQVVACDTAVRW